MLKFFFYDLNDAWVYFKPDAVHRLYIKLQKSPHIKHNSIPQMKA